VLGCDPATKAGCDIAKRPSSLQGNKGDNPDLEGALSIASTGGQTVLLEYVEGKPMDQVGWGRASKADIQAMLRFHPVKFHYEVGAPYIAERYAAPIAKRVLSALNGEADTGPPDLAGRPRHQHRRPARLLRRPLHRRRLSRRTIRRPAAPWASSC
jgi:4-phytase/acid phosphatase